MSANQIPEFVDDEPPPEAPREGWTLVRIHVPELDVYKCLQFPIDKLLWDVKQQVLASLPKVSLFMPKTTSLITLLHGTNFLFTMTTLSELGNNFITFIEFSIFHFIGCECEKNIVISEIHSSKQALDVRRHRNLLMKRVEVRVMERE